MKRRPLAVTIIGCLLAAAGVMGIVYHLKEFKSQHPFQYEIVWITLVRVLAVIAGLYMLLGKSWLALAWMAFHAVISAFHSLPELAMHVLFLAVFAYFLLGATASAYFRGEQKPKA